ncbi:MAG: type II and III secretion system protein [Verrucomicrobia bacterium]|nr:type II and III secretion system protein [Verrucomicrobiota bacterium]
MKTPAILSLPVLPAFLVLSALAQVLFAGPDNGSPSFAGVEAQSELEIAKRMQLADDYAPQAMQRGSVALMERDYETAYTQYKAAVDALPDAPNVRELRAVAMDGFSKSVMGLAESRIEEGRWDDAKETVEKLLEPQYNPNYKPAQRLLARLESPDYFNKTVTPGFVAKVEEVKTLLNEAQGLYDSARFDEATAKYEAVLRLDRYNVAARRGMEQVSVAKTRVADDAYNDIRSSMITQVDKAWETPVRRADLGPAAVLEQPVLVSRGTQSINRKLDEIIVPRINFTDATVREAIEYLRQRSDVLDTEAINPADRGVNIVLKLDQAAASQTVTIDLANLPLREALTYITNLANLKFKVEPFAVLIVPINEATDTLITKEYRVPPGFITATPTGGGGGGVGTEFESTAGQSTAKSFLESQGVQFPPGASANFLASSSRLIVRNSQENLDLVDALVESSTGAVPSQVEIESKFVEISQNNLKELGFDWLLGQFGFGDTGIFGSGGTSGNQFNSTATAPGGTANYPFLYPGGTVPVGVNPLTAGNRSGQTAITGNALDGLLFGSPVGPAAGVLALAGIFTNPQFQVVLRALNQKKGIDVLSAPKVTTKSGSSATVEVIREFRYPSEYEPPQVPQTTGSGTQPITPATPTSFDMRKVGVSLEVEPTVGSDNYTIDLRLLPEVTEFEGFINYGSPILNRGVVVTENVINYPVFSERKVETSVSIYDGQTVVLGGLMREDVQKVNDKTPLLGDIPMAGALFRSQSDQHIKRNLVIFVTATLIDPAGQALAAEQFAAQDLDLEEVPMPIDTVSASLEPPLPK